MDKIIKESKEKLSNLDVNIEIKEIKVNPESMGKPFNKLPNGTKFEVDGVKIIFDANVRSTTISKLNFKLNEKKVEKPVPKVEKEVKPKTTRKPPAKKEDK